MKILFKKIINFVTNKFNYSALIPSCYIEEINLSKKIILVYCKGTNTKIKLTFDEVINDIAILINLTSKEASWIGYYYGKYYRQSITTKKNFPRFSINHQTGQYNILMLNREGKLIYCKNNKNIHSIFPLEALAKEEIITKFSSTQACYIGILAGLSTPKKQKNISGLILPSLKIIK